MNIGGKVLIIDGDQPTRQQLAAMLNDNLPHVQVDRTGHPHTAINMATLEHYDLFIIGLELPEINGLETASALGGINDYGTTPVIFISGPGGKRKLAKRYPGVEYFQKPIKGRGAYFLSRVERFLLLMHNLTVMQETVACVSNTKNELVEELAHANGSGNFSSAD